MPHSNHTDVVPPPGLIIPRNSAELDVTALASLVATLLVLPAVYSLFAAKQTRPVSLAPYEAETLDSQEARA